MIKITWHLCRGASFCQVTAPQFSTTTSLRTALRNNGYTLGFRTFVQCRSPR
jgi:hypothetical protein